MNNQVTLVNWIAPRNQQIAMCLIEKYEIQQGYRLAYYLKAPIGCDNYTAVCIWVQYQYQLRPKRFSTLGELSAGFLALLPQHFFK